MEARDQLLVQLAGKLGRCRLVKGWTLAVAHVAIEGKLGDGENRGLGIARREVHLPFRILEDAKPNDFLSEILCVRCGIVFRHPDQDHEPGPNLAHHFSLHRNLSSRDALNDGSQEAHPLTCRLDRDPKRKAQPAERDHTASQSQLFARIGEFEPGPLLLCFFAPCSRRYFVAGLTASDSSS